MYAHARAPSTHHALIHPHPQSPFSEGLSSDALALPKVALKRKGSLPQTTDRDTGFVIPIHFTVGQVTWR